MNKSTPAPITKLKIGVVGLGMGKNHVKGFKEHPAAEVVAAVDTNPERLAEQCKEFGIEGYPSLEAMLQKHKLDIISIVTPNKFHKELTIYALEHGCHVLCEKPMAMNAAEAETMLQAARKADRQLGINFSYRFQPQSFAMKRLMESGELGNIYFARSVWHRRRGMPGFGGWFGQKELSGGGPLIDLGVHRLDFALWLMDYPEPEWIMAGSYNHIASAIADREKKAFDVEDLAVAMIRFKNGAILELEASWAANIKEREQMSTRLLGTKGGLLQYNLNEGYEFASEAYLEKDGCQYDMMLHPPVPEAKSSYYSFVDAIANNRPVPAGAQQGLTVMQILDAIYRSAATGQPVKM